MRLLVNEQYDGAWNTRSKNKSKILLQKLWCAKYAGTQITRANTVLMDSLILYVEAIWFCRNVRYHSPCDAVPRTGRCDSSNIKLPPCLNTWVMKRLWAGGAGICAPVLSHCDGWRWVCVFSLVIQHAIRMCCIFICGPAFRHLTNGTNSWKKTVLEHEMRFWLFP